MKLQIASTPTITVVDGVPCRVWEGLSESGVRCKVFVHRIAVRQGDDRSEFDQVLTEFLVRNLEAIEHVLLDLNKEPR